MRAFLIFILILIVGCKTIPEKETDFTKYYSSIPILEYPVIVDCREVINYFHFKDRNDTLVLKYIPSNVYSINGRLKKENDFVTIMYSYPGDFMYPEIFTYTENGKPIDTLSLGSFCGEWMGTYGRRIIRIEKDKTIHISDSLRYYTMDENDNIIRGTDSTVFTKILYKLNNDGHFTKLSEQQKIIDNRKK